jgi:nucleoside-diphosphate-sugar epimerase
MEICARYGASVAWGRIFVPYGEGENRQRLVPSLVAALRRERPPFGVNRMSTRDFIHAADVGEGFATLTASDAAGVFNISSGEGVTVEHLVRQAAEQLKADPTPILALASERAGEPPVIVGDSRKLKALGWRPQVPLAEGLRRSIADL